MVVTERHAQIAISKQKPSDLFACKWLRAPATIDDEGLAVLAASPFCVTAPVLHPLSCVSSATVRRRQNRMRRFLRAHGSSIRMP